MRLAKASLKASFLTSIDETSTTGDVERAKNIIEGTRPLNVTLHLPELVGAAGR